MHVSLYESDSLSDIGAIPQARLHVTAAWTQSLCAKYMYHSREKSEPEFFRSEVLTMLTMESTIFWGVTP
jgi:hypothetical protein